MIDDKNLHDFYKSLIHLKDEILNRIFNNTELILDQSQNKSSKNLLDQAFQDYAKDVSISLYSKAKHKLKAIEKSLKRINNKTFGHCQKCNTLIDVNRLKAIPYTSFCIQCKKKVFNTI